MSSQPCMYRPDMKFNNLCSFLKAVGFDELFQFQIRRAERYTYRTSKFYSASQKGLNESQIYGIPFYITYSATTNKCNLQSNKQVLHFALRNETKFNSYLPSFEKLQKLYTRLSNKVVKKDLVLNVGCQVILKDLLFFGTFYLENIQL